MKPGQESQTAVLVCTARAFAHGNTGFTQFSDPTALTLLPEDARAEIQRLRAGEPAQSARENMKRVFLQKRSTMMVLRTVAIDDAIRAAAAPQVVILGAGLDGRAWRMPELRDAVVFEVDHPDSQREKRARAATLTSAAREIRFAPVDFTKDSLESALAAAGHDPTLPTTWVWEGVVMYLTRGEIDATLAVVARRSTRGSRVVIAYVSPSLILPLVGILVRRVGEPLKSVFRPRQVRDLLAAHGFRTLSDADLAEIARALSPALARTTKVAKHLRIVTAERT